MTPRPVRPDKILAQNTPEGATRIGSPPLSKHYAGGYTPICLALSVCQKMSAISSM